MNNDLFSLELRSYNAVPLVFLDNILCLFLCSLSPQAIKRHYLIHFYLLTLKLFKLVQTEFMLPVKVQDTRGSIFFYTIDNEYFLYLLNQKW